MAAVRARHTARRPPLHAACRVHDCQISPRGNHWGNCHAWEDCHTREDCYTRTPPFHAKRAWGPFWGRLAHSSLPGLAGYLKRPRSATHGQRGNQRGVVVATHGQRGNQRGVVVATHGQRGNQRGVVVATHGQRGY
eukprot:363692-Chlamydomonas_euryale.AAC.4